MPDENERDARDRGYFHEFFNAAFVLKGEIVHLEKIKMHIIENFVYEDTLGLVKPIYSKNPLIITDGYHFRTKKTEGCEPLLEEPLENDDFYLAFVLRGEVRYIEEVKEYIRNYEGELGYAWTPYSEQRLFIVKV